MKGKDYSLHPPTNLSFFHRHQLYIMKILVLKTFNTFCTNNLIFLIQYRCLKKRPLVLVRVWVWVVVFNATFNNISFISCRSVLLVEETGESVETTDLPQVIDKLYHIKLYLSRI